LTKPIAIYPGHFYIIFLRFIAAIRRVQVKPDFNKHCGPAILQADYQEDFYAFYFSCEYPAPVSTHSVAIVSANG
jgi:hypothetical protein